VISFVLFEGVELKEEESILSFHPLGDFLNPALTLLGQDLKKSPSGQKLDFDFSRTQNSMAFKLFTSLFTILYEYLYNQS
jgi:hypothetical protein